MKSSRTAARNKGLQDKEDLVGMAHAKEAPQSKSASNTNQIMH